MVADAQLFKKKVDLGNSSQKWLYQVRFKRQ